MSLSPSSQSKSIYGRNQLVFRLPYAGVALRDWVRVHPRSRCMFFVLTRPIPFPLSNSSAMGLNCFALANHNAGCGVHTTIPNNFGPPFNNNGGGWCVRSEPLPPFFFLGQRFELEFSCFSGTLWSAPLHSSRSGFSRATPTTSHRTCGAARARSTRTPGARQRRSSRILIAISAVNSLIRTSSLI